MLETKPLDAVCAMDDNAVPFATSLAQRLGLPLMASDNDCAQLQVSSGYGLALALPSLGNPIRIDFSTGKYAHRRQFGGGRGQPLAKAVGLKQGNTPTVIDATAGFARDAFVLASLGCQLTMIEQHPVLSLLIDDAIQRARLDDDIAAIAAHLSLQQGNAINLLQQGHLHADVIYLDPMYPVREKSAQVKKEMQLLHQLIGQDKDSAELLAVARQTANKRVVVKRPKGAEYVGNQTPTVSIKSKNTRYDIYIG